MWLATGLALQAFHPVEFGVGQQQVEGVSEFISCLTKGTPIDTTTYCCEHT